MINKIMENFAKEYYTWQILLGSACHGDIAKEIFDIEATRFELLENEKAELEPLMFKNQFEPSYTREEIYIYSRLLDYYEASNMECPWSEDEKTLFFIKKEVMETAYKSNLIPKNIKALYQSLENVAKKANEGWILALRVYGKMQCEGFHVKKDMKEGKKKLLRAAKFADKLSAFSYVTFCDVLDKDASDMLLKLKTITRNGIDVELYDLLAETYGVLEENAYDEGVKVISKAIARNKVSGFRYSKAFDRIAYSNTLSYQEKERIINDLSVAEIQAISEFPMNLPAPNFTIKYDELNSILLYDENVIKSLKSELLTVKNCNKDKYVPLLIVGNPYLFPIYQKALARAFSNEKTNVQSIDISELKGFDVDACRTNIFLRKIKDKKNNLFFLNFVGDIDSEIFDRADDLMLTNKRKSFTLSDFSISLDIGSTLIICFADAKNAKFLMPNARTIRLPDIKDKDHASLVQYWAEQRNSLYSKEMVQIDSSCYEALEKVTLTDCTKILAAAFRRAGMENDTLIVNKDNFKELLQEARNVEQTIGHVWKE